MRKKEMMNIINLNSAGIDIGSKSHFVAVGHKEIIVYLHKHKVTSVAMESTGSYWQTLFFELP